MSKTSLEPRPVQNRASVYTVLGARASLRITVGGSIGFSQSEFSLQSARITLSFTIRSVF